MPGGYIKGIIVFSFILNEMIDKHQDAEFSHINWIRFDILYSEAFVELNTKIQPKFGVDF